MPTRTTPPGESALQPEQCAESLKALSDPVRLKIVNCLRSGPRNVGELAVELDVTIVMASHHLAILHHGGLVERNKLGRFVEYRLTPSVFVKGRRGNDCLDFGCCRLELPKVT